jgi:hypothetical protein
MTLFDDEILEGSPEWIDQEWERMERDRPEPNLLRCSEKRRIPSPHPVPSVCLSGSPGSLTRSGIPKVVTILIDQDCGVCQAKTPTLKNYNVR